MQLSGYNDLIFFINKKNPKLFTYNMQETVEDYLKSSFGKKFLNLMASHSFLFKVVRKLFTFNGFKDEEGQLYSVW